MTSTKDITFAFSLTMDIMIWTLKPQHRRHSTNEFLVTGYEVEHLESISGISEPLTVIYGPAVAFAFPVLKVETYNWSMQHLNIISVNIMQCLLQTKFVLIMEADQFVFLST